MWVWFLSSLDSDQSLRDLGIFAFVWLELVCHGERERDLGRNRLEEKEKREGEGLERWF